MERHLDISDLAAEPFSQFGRWYIDAQNLSDMDWPNAMGLATVGKDGRPSLRVVLLKGFSEEGFLFFTNYGSRKGQELDHDPRAALCFYWDKLGRQVRIEGDVEKISTAASEAYFHTRPRLSQIGAWASHQSGEIPSRDALENKVREMEERFRDEPVIPLPDFWGGYRLVPHCFEFWQQGEFRLHDRFSYRKEGDGGWTLKRLAP